MVASTTICTVDTHSVRLRIDDAAATIDFGHNPAYPDLALVTEIAVIYETRTGEDDQERTTKVASIAYVVSHDEHQTAFVHPNFLDQPAEWPVWVRELVDHHRPAS
ncbi:hypothetical protein ACIQVL_48500 [Streptomyces sp. NPDC090499]|uniref:hypothetical protein n=1 Tax=Streptomyces sp. NPDC090499 TaxID=3365965 RepID=UPI0038172946